MSAPLYRPAGGQALKTHSLQPAFTLPLLLKPCCPTLQFAALTTEVGMQKVSEVLPQVVDRFSPLFVGDHIVAM